MTKRVNKVELFHIWLLICSFHSVRLFTTFCVDLYVYQQIEVKLGNNPKVPKSGLYIYIYIYIYVPQIFDEVIFWSK